MTKGPGNGLTQAAIAVDLVIVTVMDADLKVYLTRRQEQPFQGLWALPGDFVRAGPRGSLGEDLTAAVSRAFSHTTQTRASAAPLQQLATFGRARRDPRGRTISTSWLAPLSPDVAALIAASHDDAKAGWFSCSEEVPWMRLSFDHADILEAALARIQQDVEHTDLAFALAPKVFTVSELRLVHEAVNGQPQDGRNFRRRFQRLVEDGRVEEAPGRRHLGRARPAKVWRKRTQPD